jgi:polysaccharide pyruvyl transferase CsaB
MKKHIKFLISGYYGHNNFGDEAILSVIIAQLRKEFDSPDITVISNNPQETSALYQVNSVYKFDFSGILKALTQCDMFISGGGSLFQDTTSFKSLVYYLLLVLLAKVFGKKTFIFAQGIGPLNSFNARLLTSLVLKTVDKITVRDDESAKLLSSLGLNSVVTADPVWMMDYAPKKPGNSVLKVGIQLRNWKFKDESALNNLADAIISNFSAMPAQIELISLQSPDDNSIMENFSELLTGKGFKQEIQMRREMDLQETVSCIAKLDLMIAMRYHAGLVAVKYCVPSLLLSYDPKVTSLAQQADLPCIPVNGMTMVMLNAGIKELILQKDNIRTEMETISHHNSKKARETLRLLTKIIVMD